MKITKTSPRTGQKNTRNINLTREQYDEIKSNPQARRNMQSIVPHLDADDREFLITGYTPEDWKEIFKENN